MTVIEYKTVVIKPLLIYATVYFCGIFSTSTMALGEFCTKTKDTYSCHMYCEQQGFPVSPQSVIAVHLIDNASSLPIRVPKSEGKIGFHSCEVQTHRPHKCSSGEKCICFFIARRNGTTRASSIQAPQWQLLVHYACIWELDTLALVEPLRTISNKI